VRPRVLGQPEHRAGGTDQEPDRDQQPVIGGATNAAGPRRWTWTWTWPWPWPWPWPSESRRTVPTAAIPSDIATIEGTARDRGDAIGGVARAALASQAFGTRAAAVPGVYGL